MRKTDYENKSRRRLRGLGDLARPEYDDELAVLGEAVALFAEQAGLEKGWNRSASAAMALRAAVQMLLVDFDMDTTARWLRVQADELAKLARSSGNA